MASLGKILHNQKRLEMAQKAYEKRAELKLQLANPELKLNERLNIITKLGKNRNASLTRYRRRCSVTGRPRGVIYGDICRIIFRTFANEGKLPGVKKASW